MADPLSVLAAIAVGIAALSYILWYYHADKKRSAGMRVVANELGMDFVRLGYTNLRMQMQMNNFQHRSLKNGQMKNLIFGKTETASIAVFDCRNTSNGGKNEHTQTVVMIELKGNDQPAIRDFFDTEIRSFCANRPDLYFECVNGRFIYFREGYLGGKKIAVKDLHTFIEEAYSLYEAFVARSSGRVSRAE